MTTKTNARNQNSFSENTNGTAPKNGRSGAVQAIFHHAQNRIQSLFSGDTLAQREEPDSHAFAELKHEILGMLGKIAAAVGILLLSWLFAKANVGFETKPLGIALLCASGIWIPSILLGNLIAAFTVKPDGGLYLGAVILAVGIRYAAGRFLSSGYREEAKDAPEPIYALLHGLGGTAVSDGVKLAVWFRRAVFPSGVLSQSIAARVGISVIAALAPATGWLVGGTFSMELLIRVLYFLCAVPILTYGFCGIFGGEGCNISPALKEGGILLFCWAVTAAFGETFIFGFSMRQVAAHIITLYISQKGGFLRGSLCGLFCGLACDALYAPAFALVGAVSGVLWHVHAAPAVVLSMAAGAAYAVYIGEFAAVRSVLPEMLATTAAAYPVLRYLPVPDFFFGTKKGAANTLPVETDANLPPVTLSPELLGVPSLPDQLDALSGILNALSVTFYHLSDRVKKPGLYEIRQMCESTADRFCANCACHELCWEQDFSATADAMGRITLCIHRKGRAEVSHAFAPLDTRCPSLAPMLAAMNDCAAVLFEEKMTRDKTEVAASDYEGMAKLLRASAEEAVRNAEEDTVLSKRLGRAVGRLGFHAERIRVMGKRRRTVIAEGIDLGLQGAADLRRVSGGMISGSSLGGSTLLGTEEVRAAFSALAGVRYQMPDYMLTEGGETLIMTMRAAPQISVECGCRGEKKEGEEVGGDAVTVFANRSDYFYVLLCDGMGSGREASVTSQISVLFLEKLLSVSTAKGAALNLLNGFLRARQGECSATVDLCEVDMITAEAHFVKCGAAATYLLRGDSIFRIASGTAPLGILKEVSAEETSFALENGDLLVFFSDGVCGECEDSSWILKTVRDAVKKSEEEERLGDLRDNAKKRTGGVLDRAAGMVLEAAKEKCGKNDDRTAAILRIRRISDAAS